jgi:hypothetical protein
LSRDSFAESSDDGTQECSEPSQEQTEVVAGCGEDSVDRSRQFCAPPQIFLISATSCSSPSRWRQRVIDDRSNGSGWQKLNSPQKYW